MKTIILTVRVTVADDIDAKRVASRLAYSANFLADDGMLAPDDVEVISWDNETAIVFQGDK